MARHQVPPRWKPGESGNPKGRPKKYVLGLRKEGYKLSEINDTIQALMTMGVDELKHIWESDKSNVLEKMVAGAIRKSLEKGNLDSVETLLNRVYGKPKQEMDITTGGEQFNKPNFEIKIITDNGKGEILHG
jgi:hypothetical protein